MSTSPNTRQGEGGGAKALLIVRHSVRDYGAWRQVYDAVKPMQTAGGVTEESVYQDPGNPNDVLVLHRFGSRAKAEAFVASSELRDALNRAGVLMDPRPRIEIFEDA